MIARRLLTLLTLATATTALAAVPGQVCQTQLRADHTCCRSHQDAAPAAVGCHQQAPAGSTAGGALLCDCVHQPVAPPAEQTTAPGHVEPTTHGVHTTCAALTAATVLQGPVEGRPLPVREAAGPPLFALSCALLI